VVGIHARAITVPTAYLKAIVEVIFHIGIDLLF
jgi:hypothetical protein